jgi:hypothetical protein
MDTCAGGAGDGSSARCIGGGPKGLEAIEVMGGIGTSKCSSAISMVRSAVLGGSPSRSTAMIGISFSVPGEVALETRGSALSDVAET